jgi:hypothetical protein
VEKGLGFGAIRSGGSGDIVQGRDGVQRRKTRTDEWDRAVSGWKRRPA